jgi:hypothetical protein
MSSARTQRKDGKNKRDSVDAKDGGEPFDDEEYIVFLIS